MSNMSLDTRMLVLRHSHSCYVVSFFSALHLTTHDSTYGGTTDVIAVFFLGDARDNSVLLIHGRVPFDFTGRRGFVSGSGFVFWLGIQRRRWMTACGIHTLERITAGAINPRRQTSPPTIRDIRQHRFLTAPCPGTSSLTRTHHCIRRIFFWIRQRANALVRRTRTISNVLFQARYFIIARQLGILVQACSRVHFLFHGIRNRIERHVFDCTSERLGVDRGGEMVGAEVRKIWRL